MRGRRAGASARPREAQRKQSCRRGEPATRRRTESLRSRQRDSGHVDAAARGAPRAHEFRESLSLRPPARNVFRDREGNDCRRATAAPSACQLAAVGAASVHGRGRASHDAQSTRAPAKRRRPRRRSQLSAGCCRRCARARNVRHRHHFPSNAESLSRERRGARGARGRARCRRLARPARANPARVLRARLPRRFCTSHLVPTFLGGCRAQRGCRSRAHAVGGLSRR